MHVTEPSGLVWPTVFFGLAVVQLVAATRFPGRGYAHLSAAMGLSAAESFVRFWSARNGHSSEGLWLLFAHLAFVGTAGMNLHFVAHFTNSPVLRRLLAVAYLGVGSAVVAFTWAASVQPRVLLAFQTAVFASTALVVVLGLLSTIALVRALLRGRRNAFLLSVLSALGGPIITLNYTLALLSPGDPSTARYILWTYGLVGLGALLGEVRFAEGLLRETTTSLAAKTAELATSYAELEVLQTELTKKEQLAAIGELAAAIAHEVRNPLAVIMNAVSALRRTGTRLADQETLLAIVDEEALRLNQLVAELLRFARPVTAARVPTQLDELLRQVESNLPEPYSMKLQNELEPASAQASVDGGLFRLALDNVVENAQQAMPKGGVILARLLRESAPDGEAVTVVEIKDSGEGMTKEVLERAKKPFFTTRPRGTGLGLAIVQRILEAHGGDVQIQSTPGEGTVVRLWLPVMPESAPSVASQRRRSRSRPSTLPSAPTDQFSDRPSSPFSEDKA